MSFAFCAYTSYYTYNHLTVNTNTSEMLSPDLPFQKNQKRIDTTFPLEAATLILVVEAETPEETSIVSIKLADILSKQTELFDSAYIATENAFFRQQALLYLSQDELDSLAKKLTDAQPFIGHLAQNYNLDGLFSIISLALNKQDENLPMDLNPLLLAIDHHLKHRLQVNRTYCPGKTC